MHVFLFIWLVNFNFARLINISRPIKRDSGTSHLRHVPAYLLAEE